MTKQDLTNQIDAEFGWLSPDEKQKLFVMMKSNWNSAINCAADVVTEVDNFQQATIGQQAHRGDHSQQYQPVQQISVGITNKMRINKLKI